MKIRTHNYHTRAVAILFWVISTFWCGPSEGLAQVVAALGSPSNEATDELADAAYGEWVSGKDAAGDYVEEVRLRVYPKAAPVPAFGTRLIPAPNDRVDGNAALFYLKAMGFFQQQSVREQLSKLEKKWRDEASEEDLESYNFPPYNLWELNPENLPMEQAREYLDLLSFQTDFLYDAARRTRFEHDRAIEREDNPIGYLLPSIQGHRHIARIQKARCRFAIAEGRIDDAVEIVGQLMAMGRHLGRDEFLVACLVGAACHSLGVEDGFLISQHPDAPNLYWAIAACSDPPLDLSFAFTRERQFFLLSLPILNEVTEEVRSELFWADFVRRYVKPRNDLFNELASWSDDSSNSFDHFQVATTIGRDYPAAREFLEEVFGMSEKQLAQYPKAQVVFLAMLKYHEFAFDELGKQFVVAPASWSKEFESPVFKKWQTRLASHEGSNFVLADAFTPAQQVIGAATRVQQYQNLWQTVEAIRLTAAENGGELPESLDQLSVPVPLDPITNRPFDYELKEGVAILQSAKNYNGSSYKVNLELANRAEQKEKKE